VAGHVLDYWPSTGRWRWHNKMYSGTHEDFPRVCSQ
jgi:hypothetical protein